MKQYKVMCSNSFATYTAGKYVAESANQAIEKAKECYRNSSLGRTLRDIGAFRFWTTDKFPEEDAE